TEDAARGSVNGGVPLVTATGDKAARLGFDRPVGMRPETGVARGASSAAGHVVAQGNAPELPPPVVPAALDPLFGPIEHLTNVEAEDSGLHGEGAEAGDGVDDVANHGSSPVNGGIEDIPVPQEERPARVSYDGERWLEAALAELDRVGGQPLPDLDGTRDRRVEPETVVAVESRADGPVSDGSAGTRPAAVSAAVEPVVGGLAAGAAEAGEADLRPAAADPASDLRVVD